MRTRPYLTAADAQPLLAAARNAAERLGLGVTIAIVDEGGVLLALERLDGARLHTPEAATLKTRTAAVVHTAIADLQAPVAENPALLSFPGWMPLTGGVPLLHHGCVVGGVGSSGGEPREDEAVCAAAVGALAALDVDADQGSHKPRGSRDR